MRERENATAGEKDRHEIIKIEEKVKKTVKEKGK